MASNAVSWMLRSLATTLAGLRSCAVSAATTAPPTIAAAQPWSSAAAAQSISVYGTALFLVRAIGRRAGGWGLKQHKAYRALLLQSVRCLSTGGRLLSLALVPRP